MNTKGDAVGGDQLGGGVDLVAGDIAGGVLPGVDDHKRGRLIFGGHQELGNTKAGAGQDQGCENDGQQVLADGIQDL